MAKRRNFTARFKAQVVLSILTGEKTPGEVCREYSLHPNVVTRWKHEFIEGAASVFEQDGDLSEQENRIAELERMIGRLTMENEVLKKASSLLNSEMKKSGRSS